MEMYLTKFDGQSSQATENAGSKRSPTASAPAQAAAAAARSRWVRPDKVPNPRGVQLAVLLAVHYIAYNISSNSYQSFPNVGRFVLGGVDADVHE